MNRKTLIIAMNSKTKPGFYRSHLHIGGEKNSPAEHSWNWDVETLTLSPSVRSADGMYHYFLRNGKIENCGDAIVNDLEIESITMSDSIRHKSGNGWSVIKTNVWSKDKLPKPFKSILEVK